MYFKEYLQKLTGAYGQLNSNDKIEQYIVDNIDRAIEQGYIKVYYQPIMRVTTGKVCGWECLARWEDPEYGFLNPALFIDVLERHSLIHKLDCRIIELVFTDYGKVRKDTGTSEIVSINLSRFDFGLFDVFEYIDNLRLKFEVPKNILRFEIAESVMLDEPELIMEQISRFRVNGYKIWMDNFGNGYSSLGLLKNYEFDLIKLDMKFLHNLGNDYRGRTMLYHIISMIKEMGILTFAEGVENREQFEFLKRIGCDGVQGFLFGRPLPYPANREGVKQKGLVIEPEKERLFFSENDINPIKINGLAAFENILDLVPAGVFWKDTQRRFLGANQMFLDYYGLKSLDDLIGKTDEDMGWHINPEPFRSDELRVINDKQIITNVPGQCIVKGEVRDIRASKKPLYLNGNVVGLMGYFIDVTVEKFEMDRLARLSTTDELTGVTNRRGYRKLVHQYQSQYLEDETDFALFMLDLDDFKSINDRHGHEYGNQVLRAVCEALRSAAADNSVIVRYGGDEFVVLHQFKSVEELEVLKSRIQNELGKIKLIDGIETVVKASIGYAIYSDFDDVERLIESADANMYKDKRSHKMQ